MTQTLHTVQMSCSGHSSRNSCKYGQLWLLSILIMSSVCIDCEFAELGVTPRLVVVLLLGNMRLTGQHGNFGPLQLLIRK